MVRARGWDLRLLPLSSALGEECGLVVRSMAGSQGSVSWGGGSQDGHVHSHGPILSAAVPAGSGEPEVLGPPGSTRTQRETHPAAGSIERLLPGRQEQGFTPTGLHGICSLACNIPLPPAGLPWPSQASACWWLAPQWWDICPVEGELALH